MSVGLQNWNADLSCPVSTSKLSSFHSSPVAETWNREIQALLASAALAFKRAFFLTPICLQVNAGNNAQNCIRKMPETLDDNLTPQIRYLTKHEAIVRPIMFYLVTKSSSSSKLWLDGKGRIRNTTRASVTPQVNWYTWQRQASSLALTQAFRGFPNVRLGWCSACYSYRLSRRRHTVGSMMKCRK